MTSRRALFSILVVPLTLWPVVTAAQDATPAVSGSSEFDLAAMSLAPDDVPGGYFDDYYEWWVPSAAFSEFFLGGAAPPSGFEQAYQSFYVSPDDGITIHSFLFAFATPEDATAGTAVVDAVLRPPLPEGTTVGPTREPGPDLGDEPRETTFVTYDTWAAGGPRADVVASSFRRDRLVAGISVERYTDPPAEGTPAATVATPVTPDPQQEDLANRLAARLDERVTAVLAGESPGGADLSLAGLVLPIGELVEDTTPVFGGYKAGADLLRCGICGEENSLLPLAGQAIGGFTRGASLGPLVDGEPTPPWVFVAVSVFDSPESAQRVLDAVRQAPNDLPTSIPVPRGSRTLAADPEIPDSRAALAYTATSNPDDPQAPADSAGVAFVMGDRFITVDVLGGMSGEEALAAATDLATQQAACFAGEGPCELVERPTPLGPQPSV